MGVLPCGGTGGEVAAAAEGGEGRGRPEVGGDGAEAAVGSVHRRWAELVGEGDKEGRNGASVA